MGDLQRLAKDVAETGRQLKPSEGKLVCDYLRVGFEAVKVERGTDGELGKLGDDEVRELLMSEARLQGWTLLPPGGHE